MNELDSRYQRRSIRLHEYDYTKCGAYYITIVTDQRAEKFGEIIDSKFVPNEYGVIAERELWRLPKRFSFLTLDEYAVMPNHIHAILTFSEIDKHESNGMENKDRNLLIKGSLGAVVRSYKASVAFSYHKLSGDRLNPVWQRNYYEHIIRNEEERNRICQYILDNPSQWNSDQENPKTIR
jgi:putative transposase